MVFGSEVGGYWKIGLDMMVNEVCQFTGSAVDQINLQISLGGVHEIAKFVFRLSE